MTSGQTINVDGGAVRTSIRRLGPERNARLSVPTSGDCRCFLSAFVFGPCSS